MSKALVGATYSHFKGGEYVVLGFATDTRDDTKLVVYMRTSGNTMADTTWFVRPVEEFEDTVLYERVVTDRFTLNRSERGVVL